MQKQKGDVNIPTFLIEKFKGKYRVLCPIDESKNDFPRDLVGNKNISTNDLYIKCAKGIQISHCQKDILEAWIPSIKRGRNILKQYYYDNISKNTLVIKEMQEKELKGKVVEVPIYKCDDYTNLYKEIDDEGIIKEIFEDDEEMFFVFKYTFMDRLEKYLNPSTSGKMLSPFSKKNLLKINYIIPDEELTKFSDLTADIPFELMYNIAHLTRKYISNLATKKNTSEMIQADMKSKGLSGKDYIHSIGKWNDYIKYLQKEVPKMDERNVRL